MAPSIDGGSPEGGALRFEGAPLVNEVVRDPHAPFTAAVRFALVQWIRARPGGVQLPGSLDCRLPGGNLFRFQRLATPGRKTDQV